MPVNQKNKILGVGVRKYTKISSQQECFLDSLDLDPKSISDPEYRSELSL